MYSKAMTELALNLLSCNQKELAARLGVSPTQISKWKKDEYISFEMENKLRALIGIGNQQPEFILLSGSIEAAAKWDKLIHFIAMIAQEQEETGYVTEPLTDSNDLLCWSVFHTLNQMGVEIPRDFPVELDVDFDNPDLDWSFIENNAISALIGEIFIALSNVYGFYSAYIAEFLDDDVLELMDTPAQNIESCLMELAASKVCVDESIAKNFMAFKDNTVSSYEEWLGLVKNAALGAGMPLRAELFDLIYSTPEDIGHKAEAESMGFNKKNLHPDIYMNELLVGMRVIHKVLPMILEKLGISEKINMEDLNIYLK
ncbi:hypothetical protein PS3A_35070 [Pseudomonas sp. 3A(2025)]